jgi:hypothetical protein
VTFLHVACGLVALLSGALALAAAKGSELHRRSGRVFTGAMLLMSSTGALIALLQPRLVFVNVVAGTLTFYLVLTGFLAVRRPVPDRRWIDGAATLVALAVVFACVIGFVSALATGKADGMTPIYVMFGGVALLAAIGDLRLRSSRPTDGRRRIARHLWRMGFAFFVAAASFFLGPPARLPAPLRHSPLRPVPVLLVVGTTVYWMARVSLLRRLPRAAPRA